MVHRPSTGSSRYGDFIDSPDHAYDCSRVGKWIDGASVVHACTRHRGHSWQDATIRIFGPFCDCSLVRFGANLIRSSVRRKSVGFWTSTFLFLLTYLGQGLLVSTLIHNQQAAVQIALVLGLLPTMLFSGFIFPIEHMPLGFQYLTTIFPARWYVQIARNQFLQGSTFAQLIVPFSVLVLYTYSMIQLCIIKFKGNLEA